MFLNCKKVMWLYNDVVYEILFTVAGYSALFRHADGELNYCVYLIPGNPKIDMDKDLPYWHNYLMNDDENIKKAFVRTDDIERMKAGR